MSSSQSLLVSELYPCLQGEGPNIGKPSILLRLQICNLRCVWCDTPYTHTLKSDPVDPSNTNSGQKYTRRSVEQVTEEIRKIERISHLIISGGEPTLQNISALLDALKDSHSIEVETNGTQIPHINHSSFSERHYEYAQWNVSPKGENAGQTLVETALSHWSQLARRHSKVFFKFVVRKSEQDKDIREVEDLVRIYNLPHDRIILMAEGTTPESQLDNGWIEKTCLKFGWSFSPRLHVLTHGSKRGF